MGRYTQSDPAGLDVGTNLFAYVKANPIAVADPYGLVPLSYIGKPNEQVQVDCRSATALGCSYLDYDKPSCSCAGGCDMKTRKEPWWARPRLNIRGIRVIFSTDCHDPGKIILEEARHVVVFQESVSELEKSAAELSQERFASKADCESACFWWIARVWNNLGGSPFQHWFIDRTHPWRRCDGSFRW